MAEQKKATTEEQVVTGETPSAADVPIDTAEPWEEWETKLCLWSIAIGVAGLVILGGVVNAFIL